MALISSASQLPYLNSCIDGAPRLALIDEQQRLDDLYAHIDGLDDPSLAHARRDASNSRSRSRASFNSLMQLVGRGSLPKIEPGKLGSVQNSTLFRF
jgi:hypothetical protein